eukprot:CAMPEP_0196653798 /NCGR_PEP_ID=MMETSP1086-20130531/3444_1 /TAXON_ID=77921 /ORGANISM="Cyanoptyche  gloeocystis , Strain SAG4.97" /LENGTH=172 /DNA_ID=CAMNT_0041985177 /DNA_START=543 /DNA_END=1061 /DNA_ORIENTATION=-
MQDTKQQRWLDFCSAATKECYLGQQLQCRQRCPAETMAMLVVESRNAKEPEKHYGKNVWSFKQLAPKSFNPRMARPAAVVAIRRYRQIVVVPVDSFVEVTTMQHLPEYGFTAPLLTTACPDPWSTNASALDCLDISRLTDPMLVKKKKAIQLQKSIFYAVTLTQHFWGFQMS